MPHSPATRSVPAIRLLAAALALAAAPAFADDTFSRTVFFGDSLTDAGYFQPLMVQQDPQALPGRQQLGGVVSELPNADRAHQRTSD